MDIIWYGQACFKVKGKTATVIIDPFDPDFTGLKFPKDIEGEIVLVTHPHKDHNNTAAVGGNPLIVAGAGEYEKSGVTVEGIATFHDEVSGGERGENTVYHLSVDGVKITHLGDLGHILTEEQVSQVGLTDILMVPVGSVYTIDAEKAAKVVAQLEPKIVIPMHYKIDGLKAELEEVEIFLKEMGAEAVAPIAKLGIVKDKLPEETQVVVLSKS